jgi:diguanylate cyclase (GGDEF)-like protein
VRFRYKLEGFDRDWVDAGTRRVAYYTNLPPGAYRFRVIAANHDGVWNEQGASFSFRRPARFRETTTFWILVGTGTTAVALLFIRLRTAQSAKSQRELAQLVRERTLALERANSELTRLSSTDALTGVANRRQFDEALDAEWRRACRAGGALSLLMIDVDYFKKYNDAYGHQRGDACLKELGDLFRDKVRRAGELVARYGGEEFAVILPGADARECQIVAERLRLAVRDAAILHHDAPTKVVTVSIGAATARPTSPGPGPESLISVADAALYRAKHSGRDQVRAAVG